MKGTFKVFLITGIVSLLIFSTLAAFLIADYNLVTSGFSGNSRSFKVEKKTPIAEQIVCESGTLADNVGHLLEDVYIFLPPQIGFLHHFIGLTTQLAYNLTQSEIVGP